MNDTRRNEILKQLHDIERFSLANYLRYAHPWTNGNNLRLQDTIVRIADQQRAYWVMLPPLELSVCQRKTLRFGRSAAWLDSAAYRNIRFKNS